LIDQELFCPFGKYGILWRSSFLSALLCRITSHLLIYFRKIRLFCLNAAPEQK
jgi:hypothetical protein